MHRTFAALLLTPALLLGGAGLAHATTSGDTAAASFVSKANAERQSRGLRAYVVRSDLAAVAARHSARMATKNTLYHNPNLGSEVSGWRIVGENVGMGGTVDSIHQAFMDSTDHRENILSRDYTEIGIGTVRDDRGVLWVTQVFRLPKSATTAPAAPKVSAPVTTTASRSVTRTPARTVTKPVVKAAVKRAPARVARKAVPARPDAMAEAMARAAALAPALPSASDGSLAQMLRFVETMGTLAH